MTLTAEQLINNETAYIRHHSAIERGYLRVGDQGKVTDYKGRFGVGYKVHLQLSCDNGKVSTQYHRVIYFVKEGGTNYDNTR